MRPPTPAAQVASSLAHYRDSTDPREGVVQMWVPVTANLREPGFTVRVEIRGTFNLPGGTTNVMGADEVFVHLGPAPVGAGNTVMQAVGLALDTGVIEDEPADGAIEDGPFDPGVDDLTSLLAPRIKPLIEETVEAQAPIDVETDVDWDVDPAVATYASGWVSSLNTNIETLKVDVEDWTEPEGESFPRLNVATTGTVHPYLVLHPHAWGPITVTDGTCHVYSTVDVNARLAFFLDIAPGSDRLQARVAFLDIGASVESVTATGTFTVDHVLERDCSTKVDSFRDGIADRVKSGVRAIEEKPEILQRVTDELNKALDVTDLSRGPLAIDEVALSDNVGFRTDGFYIRTARTERAAAGWGDIDVDAGGVDLAAAAWVDDKGGSRSGHSYVPTQQLPLVTSTGDRQRPSGGSFDVGVVVSGGTVNQVTRSLTAGTPRDVTVVKPNDPPAEAVRQCLVRTHPNTAAITTSALLRQWPSRPPPRSCPGRRPPRYRPASLRAGEEDHVGGVDAFEAAVSWGRSSCSAPGDLCRHHPGRAQRPDQDDLGRRGGCETDVVHDDGHADQHARNRRLQSGLVDPGSQRRGPVPIPTERRSSHIEVPTSRSVDDAHRPVYRRTIGRHHGGHHDHSIVADEGLVEVRRDRLAGHAACESAALVQSSRPGARTGTGAGPRPADLHDEAMVV